MKIDVNRLCRLAGLSNNPSKLVNESYMPMEEKDLEEGMYEEDADEGMYEEDADEGMEEKDLEEGMYEEDLEEGMYEEDADEGMEEMIDIDEVMLVQELRRAKKLMKESAQKRHNKILRKNRHASKNKKTILENELKAIIESEVENIMKDLNLNAQWVYGKNAPKQSKKGYSHQGSFLKGPGFK